jgi:hypothetical protein
MAKPERIETEAPVAPNVTRLRPVPTVRLQLCETARREWQVIVDRATTLEDFARRDFLGNMTKMLRRNDLIEVLWEDGSAEASLRVLAVGPQEVAVAVRSHLKLDGMDPDALAIPPGYAIDWSGDVAKHRVLRVVDGKREVVKDNLETSAAARQWLTDYLASMKR